MGLGLFLKFYTLSSIRDGPLLRASLVISYSPKPPYFRCRTPIPQPFNAQPFSDSLLMLIISAKNGYIPYFFQEIPQI